MSHILSATQSQTTPPLLLQANESSVGQRCVKMFSKCLGVDCSREIGRVWPVSLTISVIATGVGIVTIVNTDPANTAMVLTGSACTLVGMVGMAVSPLLIQNYKL